MFFKKRSYSFTTVQKRRQSLLKKAVALGVATSLIIGSVSPTFASVGGGSDQEQTQEPLYTINETVISIVEGTKISDVFSDIVSDIEGVFWIYTVEQVKLIDSIGGEIEPNALPNYVFNGTETIQVSVRFEVVSMVVPYSINIIDADGGEEGDNTDEGEEGPLFKIEDDQIFIRENSTVGDILPSLINELEHRSGLYSMTSIVSDSTGLVTKFDNELFEEGDTILVVLADSGDPEANQYETFTVNFFGSGEDEGNIIEPPLEEKKIFEISDQYLEIKVLEGVTVAELTDAFVRDLHEEFTIEIKRLVGNQDSSEEPILLGSEVVVEQGDILVFTFTSVGVVYKFTLVIVSDFDNEDQEDAVEPPLEETRKVFEFDVEEGKIKVLNGVSVSELTKALELAMHEEFTLEVKRAVDNQGSLEDHIVLSLEGILEQGDILEFTSVTDGGIYTLIVVIVDGFEIEDDDVVITDPPVVDRPIVDPPVVDPPQNSGGSGSGGNSSGNNIESEKQKDDTNKEKRKIAPSTPEEAKERRSEYRKLDPASFIVPYDDITSSHWAYGPITRAYGTGLLEGTEKGIEPNSTMTRGQVAAVIARLLGIEDVSYRSTFNDTQGWYSTYIDKVASVGIIKGYGDGTFRPDEDITRAELTAILSRVIDLLVLKDVNNSSKTFNDVSNLAWYADSVGLLGSLGIVEGYTDGSFKASNSITRAEFFVMIDRLILLEQE